MSRIDLINRMKSYFEDHKIDVEFIDGKHKSVTVVKGSYCFSFCPACLLTNNWEIPALPLPPTIEIFFILGKGIFEMGEKVFNHNEITELNQMLAEYDKLRTCKKCNKKHRFIDEAENCCSEE